LDNLKEQFKAPETNHNNQNNIMGTTKASNNHETIKLENIIKSNAEDKKDKITERNTPSNTDSKLTIATSANQLTLGNSTSHGEDDKAYELNETGGSVAKQIKSNIVYFIALTAITLILLAIGYKRNKRLE
jgi:hypothetical protein